MAHYGTLHDYRFDPDDVDDIRGAVLFDSTGEKIANIKDVVFDHDTGHIQYLVVDAGKNHNALVPLDRVYRSVVDEENFETDLTQSDLESLPRFDDKVLEDEHKWRGHLEDHKDRYEKIRERMEKEYKEKWEEGPVSHRKDSTHIITPEPGEMPAVPAPARERELNAADLTPERLTDKFASPGSPMFNSTPLPEPTRMRPAGTAARAEDAAQGAGMTPGSWDENLSRELPPRFTRFAEAIHSRRSEICGGCATCGGARRVA